MKARRNPTGRRPIAAATPAPNALAPAIDPDPGNAWERAVEQLARREGVDPARLVDEHQRRADARRCQGDDPDTANATAFEHVRERLARREAA